MTSQCREIRDLMDSYVSGELLVETNHMVIRHLAACQACAAEAGRRQRAIDLLRQSLDARVDVESLRRRVEHALDREHRARLGHARRWAFAAVVTLVAVGSVWFAIDPSVDAAAYHDSVENHVECALTIPAGTGYDPKRIVTRLQKPFIAFAESLTRVESPYRLVDAHNCQHRGREYAHFVFRDESRTASLFLQHEPDAALPATPVVSMVSGLRVYHLNEARYRIAATATGAYHLLVVSEPGHPVLDDNAVDHLLEPTVRFVRTLER